MVLYSILLMSYPDIKLLRDDDLTQEFWENQDKDEDGILQQRILLAFPFVTGIVSFATYEYTWQAFHELVELANARSSFEVVDGGVLQTQNITGILNGPVLAAVGLLLATLVSMTISNLYQRQIVVRASILQEVECLRYLQQLLQGFPPALQPAIKHHLDRYTSALFRTVLSKTTDPRAAVQNTALQDVLSELHRHVDGSTGVAAELLSQCYSTVANIKTERSKRTNAKASVFPATHYILLSLLASSIGLAFLLEANQTAFFFLDEFQLAVCWAVINGTFSALAVVLYDLNTFTGYYSLFGAQDRSLLNQFYQYAKNQDGDDSGGAFA